MNKHFAVTSICEQSGLSETVEIDVIYKNRVIKGQRLDVLVEEEVIVEIKSLTKLADVSMHKFCRT